MISINWHAPYELDQSNIFEYGWLSLTELDVFDSLAREAQPS